MSANELIKYHRAEECKHGLVTTKSRTMEDGSVRAEVVQLCLRRGNDGTTGGAVQRVEVSPQTCDVCGGWSPLIHD